MRILKKSIFFIIICLMILSLFACKENSSDNYVVPDTLLKNTASADNTKSTEDASSDAETTNSIRPNSPSDNKTALATGTSSATASGTSSAAATGTASVAASGTVSGTASKTASAAASAPAATTTDNRLNSTAVSSATSASADKNNVSQTSKIPSATSTSNKSSSKKTSTATASTPKSTPVKTASASSTPTSTTGSGSGIKSNEQYIEFINKTYKEYKEMSYGLDITKKTDLVGICYSTWFTRIHAGNGNLVNKYTITDILAGNGTWGKSGQFHYWAEPALGFYTSHDEDVIRTHMTQIAEMGADYIIIDNTNATMNWKNSQDWYRYITRPCTALLDTIVEMRAEGLDTPYVVFWNKTSDGQNWDVVKAVYDEFISVEKWKDCFVYWEGKPFVLTTSKLSTNPPCDITTRMQWGLNQNLGTSEWSFLNVVNAPSLDSNGFAEQICVAVAAQETYMSSTATAHGRNHGIFMYEQWSNAFKYRPKAVTLTWWNEWCAQLFYS